MLQIGVIIAIVMAIAGWIKKYKVLPTKYIPVTVFVLAIILNVINAWLFGGDPLDALRDAIITALGAIGIHSGVKNTLQK